METAFLVTIIILGSLLVLLGFAMLNVVRRLKAEITGLERKVESLSGQVAAQQKNLEDIRAVLERRPDDPVLAAMETFQRYRGRGLLATTVLVGVRLFRSYLGGKARRKALPVLKKGTE